MSTGLCAQRLSERVLRKHRSPHDDHLRFRTSEPRPVPRRRRRQAARAAPIHRGRAERARRPAAGQRRVGSRGRRRHRGRLLPLRAQDHLRRHRRADRRQQARRRHHRLRAPADGRQGRGLGRPGLPERAGAERAERGQHAPLLGDRARARDPAQADLRQRRDRHQRVQPAGPRRHADPGRGRRQDLQDRRGRQPQQAGLPEHGRAGGAADRPRHRAGRERRRGRHRRAHRLLRPRPQHRGPAAGRPDHPGGAARRWARRRSR